MHKILVCFLSGFSPTDDFSEHFYLVFEYNEIPVEMQIRHNIMLVRLILKILNNSRKSETVYFERHISVKYGETLVMHADIAEAELPEGWSIEWTVEGAGFSTKVEEK